MGPFSFFKKDQAHTESKAAPARAGHGSHAGEDEVAEIRRKAQQRLIGAIILVALAVLGLPMVFESQPRPLPADIPVIVPKLAGPFPHTKAVEAEKTAPSATTATTASAAASAGNSSVSGVAPVVPMAAAADKKADNPGDAKTGVKAEVKAEAKTETKTEAKTEAKADAKPVALVVQAGVYSDVNKMREAYQKLHKAGLKPISKNIAPAHAPPRYRIRMGAYQKRAEAEKVAAKVKELGLPSTIENQ